jgi:hypothetical protein
MIYVAIYLICGLATLYLRGVVERRIVDRGGRINKASTAAILLTWPISLPATVRELGQHPKLKVDK